MPVSDNESRPDDITVPVKKILVGSQEWCAFPQLGVPAILARVDSGARTSSIHAFNIQPFTRKGQSWVSFEVHPLQNNRRVMVRCEAPVSDYRKVKSSSGVAEKRYVVQTVMRLWDHEFIIELTLANRDSMGYRMLLGREAMVGRILVDPELSYCLGDVSEAILAQHYSESRRSTDGLRIVILSESANYFTNRRLFEACEERGHFPAILNIESCYLALDSDRGEIYERERGVLPAYDAMIPRISVDQTLFGIGVLRQYLLNGGVALNQPDALLRSRDKLALFQHMSNNNIPICAVGFANQVRDLEKLVTKLGAEPYQVQLRHHFTVQPSIDVVTNHQTKALAKAWQGSSGSLQVISHAGHIEGGRIRVLVIAGRIVSAVSHDGLKPNQSELDATGYDVYQLTKDEKKLVLRIAKIAGLSYVAIELVRGVQDEYTCFLNDVIASPSLEIFEKVTGKDLASLVIIEIERACDWRQQQSEI